jgi:predicted dehydrogenase
VGVEPVRFGVLSTAEINEKVLAGAGASDRVEIVAVASRDRDRADAYARAHGIGRAYRSYDALLADPELEAIYISLPNSLHVEWSIRALDAGKHVLCEKPLDRREAEVERAFDAADRAGRLLAEAFMWRHNPQTARLQELVGSGAIGEIRQIRAAFSFTQRRLRMRGRFRRGVLRFGLLALLLGSVMVTVFVGPAAAADPPAGCTTTSGVTTCVFAYTGAAQTWTLPEGVTEATFDLYGAAGWRH